MYTVLNGVKHATQGYTRVLVLHKTELTHFLRESRFIYLLTNVYEHLRSIQKSGSIQGNLNFHPSRDDEMAQNSYWRDRTLTVHRGQPAQAM